MTLVALALLLHSAAPAVEWKRIPADDPAAKLLALVRASQPTPSSLPEGSTYNYTWAQNMLAWMVAERSGLMPRSECADRLNELMKHVADWPTYHGFYFDKYDPNTGAALSNNVYFQGWWIWALLLTKAGYPEAASTAQKILSRIDYSAAGMVSPDHKFLAADKDAVTGKISYYIQQTGDISGELRTAPLVYTWLTGDVTPWLISEPSHFIDVGGQPVLAVWHSFTFDPFYVHSTFPEVGYFQRSFDNLVVGANRHRAENGMAFYATRMDPLFAWTEEPTKWPNTEHRVSKPWIAWLADPKAPVMERAWIPDYGLAQTFDHWNFSWGSGGVKSAHPHLVGGGGKGIFEASFELETLPSSVKATHPPVLTQIDLNVEPSGSTGTLYVTVNGTGVGEIAASSKPVLGHVTTLKPKVPLVLGPKNTIRIEAKGLWRVGRTATTFRSVQWSDEAHASTPTDAIGLTVFVDGQRADRENPFAFLARASGVYGNFPWKIFPAEQPGRFGSRLVAWVGPFSSDVRYAHVIHNVGSDEVKATYSLSPWEMGKDWKVVDYRNPAQEIPVQRSGSSLTWSQGGHRTVKLVTGSG